MLCVGVFPLPCQSLLGIAAFDSVNLDNRNRDITVFGVVLMLLSCCLQIRNSLEKILKKKCFFNNRSTISGLFGQCLVKNLTRASELYDG